MWVPGLPGSYQVQANVNSCLCLALSNLSEALHGGFPSIPVGGSSLVQKLGFLQACPLSVLVLGFFPFPHGTGLFGAFNQNQDDYSRSVFGVVPVACRRAT